MSDLVRGVHEATGTVGLGLSDGWTHSADGARLTFTAYGHRATVDPFVLREGAVEPATLSPRRRDNLNQGLPFHSTPVAMLEYVFPAEAPWVGCLIQLTNEAAPVPAPPGFDLVEADRHLTLREAQGLQLRLFHQPSGEISELYEIDWRTTPLLQCPEQTLWPGELAAQVANALPPIR